MGDTDSVMASIREKMRSRFGMADDGACCEVQVTEVSDVSDESSETTESDEPIESDDDRGEQIDD